MQGGGTGNFSAGGTQTAIHLTFPTGIPELTPNADLEVGAADYENVDPAAAHTIQSISATFSSSPASCATHLSLDLTSFGTPVGLTVAAGSHQQVLQGDAHSFGISADSSLPDECAGGSYEVTLTGTTD